MEERRIPAYLYAPEKAVASLGAKYGLGGGVLPPLAYIKTVVSVASEWLRDI